MITTIPDLLFARVDETPSATAIWQHLDGTWNSRTWSDVEREVARLADRMRTVGVGKGAPVALIADTRPEWTAVDMATLCLGGVLVGIYPTLLGSQIAWQLRHAEAELLIVENAEQLRKIQPFLEELPQIRDVWSIDAVDGFWSLMEMRGAQIDDGAVGRLRRDGSQVLPDDIATIIYTSGTTGEPKGALLSHKAFVGVVKSTHAAVPLSPGQRGVAFLPLAHSLQRFANYLAVHSGVEGFYTPSIPALPETIKFARPQVLPSVPRMLVKIKQAIEAGVAAKGDGAIRAYDWALGVGSERAELVRQGRSVPLGLRLKWNMADRLVLSKIREELGGELRLLVSGGAALDRAVAEWYHALGILVLEGWGLTETCAPATANREDRFKFGTVGPALEGVEIRIAPDGEVLLKSPGMFSGYFKNEDATKAAFDEEGWFLTGDIGEVDADGFLRILDRKKAIVVTAGGKNIAPTPIEERMTASAWLDQAVVIGDERPFLIALLVLDLEQLKSRVGIEGLDWHDQDQVIAHPTISGLVREAIARTNEPAARFEQVKRWALLVEPFTVENGCLTPTLKLKRSAVTERYRSVIDSVYAGQAGEGLARP